MPKRVGTAEVRDMLARGVPVLEVLPRGEYESEHIPGARHISLRAMDEPAVAQIARAEPVVVYCFDGT